MLRSPLIRTMRCRRARSRMNSNWQHAASVGIALGAASSVLAQGGPPPPPPPLPQPQFPAQNPFSEPKRVLGKILYWDEQLSSDNTMACATCHLPQFGGTDPRRLGHPGVDGVFQTPDDVFASPGVIRQDATGNYAAGTPFDLRVQVTSRSAPSVIDAALNPLQFWDGRATGSFVNPQTGLVSIPVGGSLESQIVGPPVSDVEMAHVGRSWSQITAKLQDAAPLALATDVTPDMQSAILEHVSYPRLFQQAFGSPTITAERIAFAIATYERTLIANQTDWDRFRAGDTTALTPQEQAGLNDFQTRGCAVCHTPPLFTNNTFRNLGLTGPGNDPGRQGVTNNPADARRFKVPTLRNAALKASFMHTGQFTSLAQVLNFYPNGAVQFPQNRDPIMPIPLNQTDRNNIVAFISGALVDPRVQNRQFPFDQPTLFSQRPNSNLVPFGTGLPGAGGQVPQWIALTPPNVGNADFKLGVRSALAGASATLRVSSSPPIGGVVSPDQLLGPFTLNSDLGSFQGFATAHWPIPSSPGIAGRSFFMQWFVDDPSAIGGVARSQPLRVTILGSSLRCPSDLNLDGHTDSQDFFAFLTAFFVQDPAADYNGTGGVTSQDFFDFLAAFLNGC
ncbi:MAG: cytochrome c peroxidase [Phycisphaerales bacterium]